MSKSQEHKDKEDSTSMGKAGTVGSGEMIATEGLSNLLLQTVKNPIH